MNLVDQLVLEYGRMGAGQRSTGELCPKCKGGRTGEGSLSVFRHTGSISWRCWRASCDWHGRAYTNAAGTFTTTKQRPPTIDYELVDEWPVGFKRTLATKLHLTEHAIDAARWDYTPKAGIYGARIIMPVFDPEMRVRGYNFRSYWEHWKKAIIERRDGEDETEEPMQCWYRHKYGAPVLYITEDQPSALRMYDHGYDGLALLGTELTPAKVREIRRLAYKHIYLCLDKDATAKAVQYAGMWRHRLGNLKVCALEQDIKDMPHKEFDKWLASTEPKEIYGTTTAKGSAHVPTIH